MFSGNIFLFLIILIAYLGGYNKETYIKLLKEIIVGNMNPENVILLEIFPHNKKQGLIFIAHEDYLGIKTGLPDRTDKGRKEIVLYE